MTEGAGSCRVAAAEIAKAERVKRATEEKRMKDAEEAWEGLGSPDQYKQHSGQWGPFC